MPVVGSPPPVAKRKGVEPIHIQVRATQKLVHVCGRHAVRQRPDVEVGLMSSAVDERAEFRRPQSRNHHARLAIEVREIELAELGETERPDAEPFQRQKCAPPTPSSPEIATRSLRSSDCSAAVTQPMFLESARFEHLHDGGVDIHSDRARCWHTVSVRESPLNRWTRFQWHLAV
jgi:hypothetical protein